MRNRVAPDGVRMDRNLVTALGRSVTVMASLPVTLVLVATQAAADPAAPTLAAESLPSNLTIPVGVGAVILGLGGLVAGAFRRRRISLARSEAPTAVIEKIVEPVRGERV